MLSHLLYLREQHGEVYATELPSGRIIPWKSLSIEDFFKYDSLALSEKYPLGCIENEIFSKCVLDPVIVENIDSFKAGTISSVVAAIISVSGPQSIEELNYMLQVSRLQTQGVLHELVRTICLAFPAYKPEDLYSLPYELLMQRVALAERKLIEMGFLKEPLLFEEKEEKTSKRKVDPSRLKQIYDNSKASQPIPQPISKIPTDSSKTTIITESDVEEHSLCYTGHEKGDKFVLEHNMQKDTTKVYQDYLSQMKKGEKVQILSHEERVARAKARQEENRKKIEERTKILKEQKKLEDIENYKQIAKAKAAKRKRKKLTKKGGG